MKHLSRAIIAVFMAVLMGALLPVQVFADTPDYISEVKIFMGDYSAADSEGYTLLKDGNNPVDLNQNAGGGMGSKGEKAVYLGYKTTKESGEAITDLALMNMKGGYDVAEYEALMEKQLKSQILPFIENFISAVKEYRANYNSKRSANKERAKYVHDALNKLYDDDTEKPLGDLLLNETKQELGNDAYNALSAEEKKEHADLATIIAQANGRATLIMESLITRAADSNSTVWLERFEDISYDDLIEQTGETQTDAKKTLAKLYDDDAQEILDMWKEFKKHLDGYDEAVSIIAAEDKKNIGEDEEFLENYNAETASDEEIEKYAELTAEIQLHAETLSNAETDIFCHDYLEDIEYGDGTMLDFFTQDYDDVEAEIEMLYPLVASLTKGQRAGLEFVTLQDLVVFSATDRQGYKSREADELETASIYLGVDRAIYEKGGVALTSDALRSKVAEVETPEQGIALHIFTGISVALAIAGASVFAASAAIRNTALKSIAEYNKTIARLQETIRKTKINQKGLYRMIQDEIIWNQERGTVVTIEHIQGRYGLVMAKHQKILETAKTNLAKSQNPEYLQRLEMRSVNCRKMMIGSAIFTVVMVGISAYLAYLDYQAMKEYYNVTFTPIPHYMVDEKDLISYNKKGEKVVNKNQSAYYKAVECNRTEADEMFKTLGTCADMNGDVGQQWLALYAVKNELMEPILASSLKAVIGSTDIPAGYKTGIHMFGSEAAFNLNNSYYDWNNEAPATYVYFKTDENALSAAGSVFMPSMLTLNEINKGTLVLAAGGGLILGAAITAIAGASIKKKRNKATQG